MRKVILLFAVFSIAYGWTDAFSYRLTSDDVIDLVQAGFSPGLVLHAIQVGGIHFSSDAVARLKSAGADAAVVSAMAAAQTRQTAQTRLLDPGVYFRSRDASYSLLHQEAAKWQGSRASVTGGLTKISLTGTVDGETSFLRLNALSELLIVCAPDDSPAEYQLLRAEVKNDTRTFRAEAALRGTAVLGIGGNDKTLLPVETDATFDLGVRWFLKRVPKGEYALVRRADLITGGSVRPTAAIYTFTIE